MATPGEMVEMMAEVLNLSRTTVAQYDRVLAEKGMRSKSGRGTSAAKVTARDCTNLLIAILGSFDASIKEADKTCFRYRNLPVLPRVSSAREFRRYGLHCLGKLPALHTFGDAVEALIQESAEGGKLKLPFTKSPPENVFGIEVHSPQLWVGLIIQPFEDKPNPRMVYTAPFPPFDGCELKQTRHISYATIRVLGTVVAHGAT